MRQLLFLGIWLSIVYADQNCTNALIHESSPYLKQHAHNPVNWYPWGEEALKKAKKEHKMIFLSIGYSTCHWCHVMEEESFTDPYIAKLFNDDFVAIKVDREEFPQIDKKYQQRYTQVHGKRGGWPLSVFLSPDGEVFHLATYIPKEEGYGSPGLINLLTSFKALQKNKRAFEERIKAQREESVPKSLKTEADTINVQKALAQIAKQYDPKNGGFSSRPKFPEASKIALLLDSYALDGNKTAFSMANRTLSKMAKGGIYDQISGGFFRYTTDTAWQIPHFEKMLYTNAELIPVYAKAYLLTHNGLYKKVIDETIAVMEKHYQAQGVYLSASDADSDGEEGGYFTFEYIELKSTLKEKGWSPKEIEEALAYLGIEADGNIDGDISHPHITTDKEPVKLNTLKEYLRAIQKSRTFPFVDKKINTAWNAMMIKALFEASKLEPGYLGLAQKRLDALWKLMRRDVVLYHQTLLGERPRQEALLEDYAFLIDALLSAYKETYEVEYKKQSEALTKEALSKFYRKNQWYLSDDSIEAVADFDDRYYTSALSVMLDNLLRIAALREEPKYIKMVKDTLAQQGNLPKEILADTSKMIHTMLRLQKEDVVIHASKEKLRLAKKQLEAIKYPFVLRAVQESDEYLACRGTVCFAHHKNIEMLIKKINKVVSDVNDE